MPLLFPSIPPRREEHLRGPPDLSASNGYDPKNGPLAHIFAAAQSLAAAGAPNSTLTKDDFIWAEWKIFCSSASDDPKGLQPWRPPYMTLSQPALRAELDILVAFILFRYSRIKPRSKANIAGKPSTAIQAFHALSRIHARHGIILPPFKTLKHHMKGLFQLHTDEFGNPPCCFNAKSPLMLRC